MPFKDAANFALSPQAPKGPPPKPPPRPANKGHGRSASLDLNNFQNFAVTTSGYIFAVFSNSGNVILKSSHNKFSVICRLKVNLAAQTSQRGATLPAQGSLRHPCSSMPSDPARFSTAIEWQGKLL